MTESSKETFDPFDDTKPTGEKASLQEGSGIEGRPVLYDIGLAERMVLRPADFNYEDGIYTYKKEFKIGSDKRFVTLLDFHFNLRVLIPTGRIPEPASYASMDEGVLSGCRTYLELEIGSSKFQFLADVSKIGCLADRNNGTHLTLLKYKEQT